MAIVKAESQPRSDELVAEARRLNTRMLIVTAAGTGLGVAWGVAGYISDNEISLALAGGYTALYANAMIDKVRDRRKLANAERPLKVIVEPVIGRERQKSLKAVREAISGSPSNDSIAVAIEQLGKLVDGERYYDGSFVSTPLVVPHRGRGIVFRHSQVDAEVVLGYIDPDKSEMLVKSESIYLWRRDRQPVLNILTELPEDMRTERIGSFITGGLEEFRTSEFGKRTASRPLSPTEAQWFLRYVDHIRQLQLGLPSW